MAKRKLFDLTGRIVVITGGYGHLGVAMTNALLEHHAHVIVAGKNQSKFDNRFAINNHLTFFETDITSTDSIKRLFKSIDEKFGKIDVLINNAYTTKGFGQENITDEDWAYTLDGVLTSVYKCIREGLPLLKKSKHGKIINIASMYGVVSPDFQVYEKIENFINPPHYGAAKAGIIQLTKYFASYLGLLNIQVNSITPGPFPTKEVQEASPLFIERLSNKTMLRRIGEPEDITGPVILLSSSGSDFITGHNLIVDGGWTSL
jgi:NAD(P)-dependent dehydrogenase (short-subunit alcohol dehydrogenase family)